MRVVREKRRQREVVSRGRSAGGRERVYHMWMASTEQVSRFVYSSSQHPGA